MIKISLLMEKVFYKSLALFLLAANPSFGFAFDAQSQPCSSSLTPIVSQGCRSFSSDDGDTSAEIITKDLPYEVSFADASGEWKNDWTTIDKSPIAGSTWKWSMYNNFTEYAGGVGMAGDNGRHPDDYFVSPAFKFEQGKTYTLDASYVTYQTGGTLELGYMTDKTDASTFVKFAEGQKNGNAYFPDDKFDFTVESDGVYYLAFHLVNQVSANGYAYLFNMGVDEKKAIPEVKVVAESPESVESGSKAILKAIVSEGTAPFYITWTNGKHEKIATAKLDDFGTASSEYIPTECDIYYVAVKDGNDKTASDTCRVAVTGDAVTATFENLYLDGDGFWAGPDTKGTIGESYGATVYDGSFVSGSYQFQNSFMPEWNSWAGFAYSNRTATDFVNITPDMYNSVVGHGYADSENYAVAYDKGLITVLNNPVEGDTIRGFYITNEAWAMECIKNGNAAANKFKEGDYLKVTFTGSKADGTTSSVDYYLADYRSKKEADRYSLDTWQWVDLRSLGKVKSISFALDGTDKANGYLNTSAYFCMDNFNGERVVAEATTQTAGGELDLSKFFTFDDASATVTYAFADAPEDDLTGKLSITADGKLKVDSDGKKFDVVVSATQRGKIQFLRIPFDIPSGVNAVSSNGVEKSVSRYNLAGQIVDRDCHGIKIVRKVDGKTFKVAVK